MTQRELLVIIVLLAILILELALPLSIFGVDKYYKYAFMRTRYIALDFGYLIGINGKISKGKTSISSGLSHIYQLDFLQRIHDLMKQYQSYLNKIDFRQFNDRVYQLILEKGIKQVYEITDAIMDEYQLGDVPVYNYLTFTSMREMTKSYVIAFASMVRNNFVASKTRFYSRVTNTMNLDYEITQQDIYNVIKSGDYFIEDYLVEVIDEAQDDNAAELWREQEKTGRKQYRNKYRHIHEQNNRMISIKQDESDEVRKQRSLYQTNLKLVDGVQVKFIYRFVFNILQWIYRIEDAPYRIFRLRLPYMFYYLKHLLSYDKYSFDAYCEARYDKPSITRDVDHNLMFLKWFLESLNYNVFTVQLAEDTDDLGKESKTETFKLVIPSIYCFTYPRFEFNQIQTDLLSKSNKDGSVERNLFKNPEFFNIEKEKEVISDDIQF